MSVADILISIITFLVQKLVLPLLPTNLPLFSFNSFNSILSGSLQHNLIWAFAGIGQLFNLKLLFIVLLAIISGEIVLWSVKVAFFVVKLVRGGG